MLNPGTLTGIGNFLTGGAALGSMFGGKGGDGIDVSENARLNQALGPINAQNALLMGNAATENYLKMMNAQMRAGKEYKIHRLAMLGQPIGGAGQSSPLAIGGGQSSSGSHISDAIGQVGGLLKGAAAQKLAEEQRRVGNAEAASRIKANEARAQRDEMEAAATLSSMRRAAQASMSQKDKDAAELLTGSGSALKTPGGSWKTGKAVEQQKMEDEYGGIVGETYGIYRAISDYFKHNRNSPRSRRNCGGRPCRR